MYILSAMLCVWVEIYKKKVYKNMIIINICIIYVYNKHMYVCVCGYLVRVNII